MSSAEQPGKGSSGSQGNPAGNAAQVVVEKTLDQLESMTATLAREVGTPGDKPGVEAPSPSAAGPQQDASVEPTPARAEGEPSVGAGAGVAPVEANGLPEAGVQAEVSSAADSAGSSSAGASEDVPSEPATPVSDEAPLSNSSAELPAADATPVVVDPADPQAEIDHEINEALQHLQTGQPAGDPAADSAVAPVVEKSAWLKRVGRVCHRGLNVVLWPLVLVLVVLDLPFRWLPAVARELLGYVAVGTALMAGALWAYIMLQG